jgi:hypothetical protein
MELDRVPLWRGDHVEIRQLVEDFARYLYLPRLKNPAVLVGAVRDGLSLVTWERETFAYADSFDEATTRYRGLRAGQIISIPDSDPSGLLVKPEVARGQLDADQALERPTEAAVDRAAGVPAASGTQPTVSQGLPDVAPRSPARRFHGSVTLDPLRVGADAGKVANEVIAHLAGLPGARIRVTLEIEATAPAGIPDQVVRTVTENSRTLKFTTHGFERE